MLYPYFPSIDPTSTEGLSIKTKKQFNSDLTQEERFTVEILILYYFYS